MNRRNWGITAFAKATENSPGEQVKTETESKNCDLLHVYEQFLEGHSDYCIHNICELRSSSGSLEKFLKFIIKIIDNITGPKMSGVSRTVFPILSYRQEKNPEKGCLKWTTQRKKGYGYKINRNIWQTKRTSVRRGIRFRPKCKAK
ncbi:hypothetical protein AVEN_117336-1 [Araneus ventricosus]|uniref:Uncharacterized protein n=1 Tax=Araneus ventricosus TaxID=182803 RepID=A0A4Y2VAV7_ARAVE|nr:hypothetical protein AVEN_169078-1 [Araneus ventricosus]GBO28502.1 hypothetical protein AVEN_117336-1 [Araneus ventricosus]